MIKINALLISIIVWVGFISCNTRLEEATEPSEGMAAEVLVISKEADFEAVKSAFENHFNVFDSNLLIAEKADEHQFEKSYGFWHATEKSHDGLERKAALMIVFGDVGKYGSDLSKTHQIAAINSKNGFSMQVFKNIWAKPQTVIRIRYGRDMNAEKILKNGGALEISKLLYEYEIAQGLPGNIAADKYTDSVTKVVANNYGFGFLFPPQFRLSYANTDVVWLQQESQKFYRHIFVNIFSDSTPIQTVEQAINNRNFYSKKYIKNAEGTSTLVSRSTLFPLSWEKGQKAGKYNAMVLRGWYQEEGTFRRGPFVRYYIHDRANHRYIAFDGFVYAPDLNRQSLYRMFDIMAQSIFLK